MPLKIDCPIPQIESFFNESEVLSGEEMAHRLIDHIQALSSFEEVATLYEHCFHTGLIYTNHLPADLKTRWDRCGVTIPLSSPPQSGPA